MHQLKHMHLLVLNLFPKAEIGNFPLAGRLQYFLENWKILTNDPKILQWVSGLKIDFREEPFQERVPDQAQMSIQESELIIQEVEAMLRKGAVHLVHSKDSQFLSNLFLVPKKDVGKQTCYQSEGIKFIHPLFSLQNRRFASVKSSFQRERWWTWKMPTFAFLCTRIKKKFQWKRNIYEFLRLCFVLDPPPRIFTKLLKIPIAVFWQIQVRIMIYLDDMLLMSQTVNSLEIARDTLIFLLQSLGFVINLQKSVLMPLQKIELLGLDWNVKSLFQTPERDYGKWPVF